MTKNKDDHEFNALEKKVTKDVKSGNLKKILYPITIVIITSTVAILLTNYMLIKQDREFAKQINFLTNQQTEIKSKFEITSAQITSNLNERLQKVQQDLNLALKEKWYQGNDWVILKARYYLDLAVINAKWTDDLNTSVSLLEEADILLKNLPGEEISEIRKVIATEQLAIKQVEKVDFTKILYNLDAAQKAINTLPEKNTLKDAANKKEISPDIPTNWQEHLKFSLKKLNNLIIIRHNNDKIADFITPNYLAMLSENIRLNIQQAEWSVMERNQEVFQLAIDKAIENIMRGYDIQSSKTKAVIKQLQMLKKVVFNNDKPDISRSLQLLNLIIDNQVNDQRQTS